MRLNPQQACVPRQLQAMARRPAPRACRRQPLGVQAFKQAEAESDDSQQAVHRNGSSELLGRQFKEYMSVRDYELDSFRVVNNAVYASYLQHARRKALQALTGSVHAARQEAPAWALASLRLKYVAPLRSGDSFVVVLRLGRVTPIRLELQEEIVRLPTGPGEREAVVVTADATVVALDAQLKPKRISRELLEALRQGRPMTPGT